MYRFADRSLIAFIQSFSIDNSPSATLMSYGADYANDDDDDFAYLADLNYY